MWSATYRLQLRGGVDLDEAAAIVPYLERLGASHIYLSPIWQARHGSAHGYDVTDPTRIDQSLGGEAAYARLARRAAEHRMGILLDIVPNHMAAHVENPWWRDILARGRRSPHADFFDIDWEAGGGRLALPVLDGGLHQALETRGVHAVNQDGAWFLDAAGQQLPLRVPAGEDPTRRSGLERVLDGQPYRLMDWRRGDREANHRRFFNIHDLAGLRVEAEAVFEAVHAEPLRLVREGTADGLRVDHIDGLADPGAYLDRLRARLDEARPSGPAARLYVEKIQAMDEPLPPWPVDGATGYEAAARIDGVLIDPEGIRQVAQDGFCDAERDEGFVDLLHAAKHDVVERHFASEFSRLADGLARLLGHPWDKLRQAVVEMSVTLGVYRTYFCTARPSPDDVRRLAESAEGACRQRPGAARAVRDIQDLVLRTADSGSPSGEAAAWVRRWQQATGAVMAKGLEDTAFYRDPGLTSVDAVGHDPTHAAVARPALHAWARERAARQPRALSATSTHDSKRSEDVRARLHVLSEIPDAWREALEAFRRTTRSLRGTGRDVPGPRMERLVYQMLLGAWPTDSVGKREGAKRGDGAVGAFEARMRAFVVKAAREAKLRTDWNDPDLAYEAALQDFVSGALHDAAFRDVFDPFLERMIDAGIWNSLAMVLLKSTLPGVPDFYQGQEMWDLRLVDPDNRAPVDFRLRRRLLDDMDQAAEGEAVALLEELVAERRDGRIKMYVTSRALRHRRSRPEVFAGDHVPIEVDGRLEEHVLAFARRSGARWSLTVVPRWTTRVGRVPVHDAWADTWVRLPDDAPRHWTDVFSGRTRSSDGRLDVASLFEDLPLALLSA